MARSGSGKGGATPSAGIWRPKLNQGQQRDLALLALIVAALISTAALLWDASALRPWRLVLLWLFGRGAPLLPAWLLLLSVSELPGFERLRPGPRRLVGFALITLGLLTALHLGASDPVQEAARNDGGGHVGLLLRVALTGALGPGMAWGLTVLAIVVGLLMVLADELPLIIAGFLLASRWGLIRMRGEGGTPAPVAWLARQLAALRGTERQSLADELAATQGRPVMPPPARARPAAGPGPAATSPVPSTAVAPRVILPSTGERRLPTGRAPLTGPPPRIGAGLARWQIPAIELLDVFPEAQPDLADAEEKARIIDQTLANFKVEAHVKEIHPGPSFTQFAVEPGVGVKVRRITELQNDLALALAVPSLRIEAPVPGKARVGIEIPNGRTATVGLRETLEAEEWQAARLRMKLPIVLGRDVSGKPVVVDMARMPHLLIAGATGAGKSVCLNAIIICLLLQLSPEELRLVMIDPKRVELSSYNGIPHLQAPVVTEMDKVVSLLRKAVEEMERRYNLLQSLGVRNLDGYLARCQREPRLERLPYLLIIVDELADLMMTAPDEVEGQLCRLAQMGRATGIHLILATQRPSVDVVTGLIKANFPSRIAFAVSSQIDSRVILDSPGAERLMGRGDMLYQASDAPKPQRIQGVFLSDGNIEQIVLGWRHQSEAPTFDPSWANLPSATAESEAAGGDDLLEQAVALVRQHGTASASLLQRRLRIGYNRAARLIEMLEAQGIIGPASGRTRTVLEGETGAPSVAPSSSPSKRDEDLPL